MAELTAVWQNLNWKQVATALIFVGIALALSGKQKLGLEKDFLIGTARVFVQLMVVGFVLNIVFDLKSLESIVILLSVMVMIGAFTCARTAPDVPNAQVIAFVAMALGTLLSVGLLAGLSIVPSEPRTLIPLAGIAIGAGANISTLAFGRVRDEMAANKARIEAALCLGATSSQAMQSHLQLSLRRTLSPTLVSLKLVGIVHLPGAMTGMIIAGADVFDAVFIQVVVFYLLLCQSTVVATIVSQLTARQFFSSDHRLLA
ncbi:MAG: iron export ABC transporter permease subunit FetB [Candidatus Coatesbacteria bacterium]|nr:iron export ABC transporter permease subunit FetB [Candidatus Coatesbacteria bacterium]